MEAHKLETEFPLYWSRLTDVQKESVFFVVKNFAAENERNSPAVTIPKEVMDEIWKNREDYMNGVGKNYSWEEVKDYILNRRKKAS